jgi:hypothetical protein
LSEKEELDILDQSAVGSEPALGNPAVVAEDQKLPGSEYLLKQPDILGDDRELGWR